MSRFQDVIQQDDRASQPAATDVPVGTLYGVTDEGNIIERSDGSNWVAYSPTATWAYLQFRDQKAQNTAGGTFTSGAWRTRDITTEVVDDGGYGSLAANQITLVAGTYLISAIAPAVVVNAHQARLQNVTDGTTVLLGTSSQASTAAGVVNHSVIKGQFTIGASKALEIQHQCATTAATFGFGVAANFATEVYTVVEFWRVA